MTPAQYFFRARHSLATALSLLIACVVFLATPNVHAQKRDQSLEKMLEKAEIQGEKATKQPVGRSSVKQVNLDVNWRLFKRVLDKGEDGSEQLRALAQDGRSFGRPQQAAYSFAVTTQAGRQEAPDAAYSLFESAQDLAPRFPYPHFAEARWIIMNDPGQFTRAAVAYADGVKAGTEWADMLFPWSLKLLLYALLAFFSASLLFMLGQVIRQFGTVAYDIARVLPRGFSSNQAVVILVGLALVPGLLLQSPLIAALTFLAIASVPQRLHERAITALVFGSLIMLPAVEKWMTNLATYQGSEAQLLFRVQHTGCKDACLEDLNSRLEKSPDNELLRYTVLLAEYRTGKRKSVERVAEEALSHEWSPSVKPYAQTLGGAALVARAKTDEAIEVLQEARYGVPESAAPLFNVMRAHQMNDSVDEASAALTEASSREVSRVNRFLSYERRDVNSYLMVDELPTSILWKQHLASEPQMRPIQPFWRSLAGPKIPFEQGAPLGWLGLIILGLGAPLALGRKTSTPCPRCGLPRDPKEAHEKTGNHRLCTSCYRTFVTGAGLDYHARIYNERVLGRRESMLGLARRVLSVLTPGLGHHLAGRSDVGFPLTFILTFGALLIWRPLGMIRPAQEIIWAHWAGEVVVAWILVVVGVVIALGAAGQDVEPIVAPGVKK